MDELKERFTEADLMIGRDHWRDIVDRAATPVASPGSPVGVPAPRRRAVAALVAFAVFAAASVFAWNLSHPDVAPLPPPPGEDHPVDLASELPVGWSELPEPPEVRRAAAIAWTGSKLIQWGGYVYVENSGERPASHEGSVFDAASRRWEQMTSGPLSARSAAASAWTGEEFLIWGGRTGECCVRSEMFLSDGAAYDPAARTWRSLPEAPIEARAPLSVWTGDELIVWGSTDRTLRYRDGAAYDPRTDTWHRIAEAPIELTDAVAVWSGEEMYVFGAALHGGNHPETETAIGAAYDPRTDAWRELPPSLDTLPNANTAVWAGDRLIAVDYGNHVEVYRPASGRWQVLDPMPLDDGEDIPSAAYIDDWVLVSFFGQVAAYSFEDERWRDLTGDLADEVPGTVFPSAPVAAGGVFLVLDAAEEGPRLLAYRPPAPNQEVTPFVPATEMAADEIRMPLTFPDGSTATLEYPTRLDLASLGVQPEVSYLWKDDPPPRFPILFLHDPQASIAEYVEGVEPIENIGSGPAVEIWEMSEEWSNLRRLPQGLWLRYGLPSWTVLAAVERPDQAEEVSANLAFRETEDGYPVVETTGPIGLSHESGEGEGPMLAIGSVGDRAVLLWIEGCSGGSGVDEVLESGAYGSACLADGRVTADIYGDASTVEAIVEGLRIEDFVST
jgi:hypothetical protein